VFYFPSDKEKLIFECNIIPLPPKLLGYLVSRGLNVMILPEDEVRAKELCYGLLRLREERFQLVDKYPHEIPHYDAIRKTIIIPELYLEKSQHNVVLHELGHAVDNLYYDSGYLLSNHPAVAEAIRKVPPLDSHCQEMDTHWGSNCEQFASSFEAFFNEKILDGAKEKKSEFYHTVNDIDESFISLARESLVKPFQDDENGW